MTLIVRKWSFRLGSYLTYLVILFPETQVVYVLFMQGPPQMRTLGICPIYGEL